MDLSPISPRPTAVDECTNRLRRAILGGELRPGTRLPAERQLAATLLVNRVTIRGALGRLTASGLLQVRQGSGYTVRDYEKEGGSDLLAPMADIALHAGALPALATELLRVRRHLAAALLERLVEVRPDTRGVAAAVDRFGRVAGGHDLGALADADLAVLSELLSAAQSPALSLCLNPITSVLRTLPSLAAAMYRNPSANVQGWQFLLRWLEDPDPAGIAALTEILAERDRATVCALLPSEPERTLAKEPSS